MHSLETLSSTQTTSSARNATSIVRISRHPVVLAFIARHVINGAVEGARQGYRTHTWTETHADTRGTLRRGSGLR